jgi:hypothetical protein
MHGIPFQPLLKFDEFFNSETEHPEILYLGDSVVERIAKEDSDQRTLGQMVVAEMFPKYKVGVISFSAYHSVVYYALLKGLEVTKRRPKVVILPINIRSFSPQWDLRPRWQYKEELISFEAYRKSGAQIIRNLFDDRYFVPRYLQNKYRSTRANYPLSPYETIGQFLDTIASSPETEESRTFRKQQIFIFNYAHPLAVENRKLVAITEILNFLINSGIKIFIYITPINVDAGVKYVGEEIKNQILTNIHVVENVLSAYQRNSKFSYSNWCVKFSSDFFFYEDLATEHLNQNGRLKLAKLISHEVALLLNSDGEEKIDKGLPEET